MTLNHTIQFFKNLLHQTSKKSELKMYKEYIEIFSDLENKGLSENEIQAIETFLSSLNLTTNAENSRKFFKRKLSEIKKFLKKEFSFITKGYYTTIGISIGMCFGISIGTSFFGASSGVSLGMIFGMIFGFAIGRYKDAEAEKQNRVLKTTSPF